MKRDCGHLTSFTVAVTWHPPPKNRRHRCHFTCPSSLPLTRPPASATASGAPAAQTVPRRPSPGRAGVLGRMGSGAGRHGPCAHHTGRSTVGRGAVPSYPTALRAKPPASSWGHRSPRGRQARPGCGEGPRPLLPLRLPANAGWPVLTARRAHSLSSRCPLFITST